MGQRNDESRTKDEYRFINETIKQEPLDKKRIVRKIAAIAGSGLLFGCCASAACVGMFPVLVKQFGMKAVVHEDLRIVTPSPTAEEAKLSESNVKEENHISEENPLNTYEAIHNYVFKVSEKPRKALVTMRGLSQSQDILNDTQLTYSSSQGIVFLESDREIYILTYGDEFNDIYDLEVTFGNGATAVAHICEEDKQTGLLVACVEKKMLDEETLQNLHVADLGISTAMPKKGTVIAIGCPAGDEDAVICGMITSVSGKVKMADTEYNILATDMHGHPGGSGVLLDVEGNVIGVIMKQKPDSTESVRAYAVSQIRPLIERMTNGKAVNYTGIYGTSISHGQADRLDIPKGIYVDKVEDNSPAMTAGIQCGDIITSVNGVELKDMREYYKTIQEMDVSDKIQITISRNISGGDGKYAEMNFLVRIAEK